MIDFKIAKCDQAKLELKDKIAQFGDEVGFQKVRILIRLPFGDLVWRWGFELKIAGFKFEQNLFPRSSWNLLHGRHDQFVILSKFRFGQNFEIAVVPLKILKSKKVLLYTRSEQKILQWNSSLSGKWNTEWIIQTFHSKNCQRLEIKWMWSGFYNNYRKKNRNHLF